MIGAFNNHFKQICINLNPITKVFVLGLSGGIDSMALLYLLKNFLENNKKFDIEIFPVIIDHNLRQDSSKEAHEVENIAKKLGFKTSIKKICGKKPTGNIQNWARKKRRDLLCEATYKLSAHLLLAHHFDDQAETLFMRFKKNSGLDGLQGMQSVKFWNGILIIRPLLIFKKKQLRTFVDQNNINFFEDSSNMTLKFERVKTRYLLDKISQKKWPNISQELNKFSNTNTMLLEKIKVFLADWASENILIDVTGAARVDLNNLKTIFEKSSLLTVNIIGKIIQTVGGKEFPPKRKKTLNLIRTLFYSNFRNKTLGNVKIFQKNNYLFFLRELRNLNFNMEIKKDKNYIFDGRYIIVSSKSGNLISSNGNDISKFSNKHPFFEYRDIINNTIPCLRTLEGSCIKPHLNIIEVNSNIHEKSNQKSFSLYLINKVLV